MTDETIETKEVDNLEALRQELKAEIDAVKAENLRLKQFNDKVIEEKRVKEEKHRKEKEELLAKTDEGAKQLADQWKAKAEELEQKLTAKQQKEYENRVAQEARKLADKLAAKNPGRAELLAEKIARRIKLNEDGSTVVLDDNGNQTISQVDVLVNEMSQRYNFLCDGIDSSGGGVHSSANNKPKKSFADMTEAEKVALYRESPDKYEQAKNG